MATNKEKVATPELLNAVRADASAEYQNNVPQATPFNLQEVGNPILSYEAATNEFLNTLINKIVLTLVVRKSWENPLAMLKKGTTPLGYDIEEVQTNPAVATDFDGKTENGYSDILKPQLPDTKAAWYRLNRQDKYKVTINNEMLTNAFVSWDALENFIASIVDTLYNANTIDEFKYTKQIITDVVNQNHMVTRTVTMPTNKDTGEAFQQAVQELSLGFMFPSTAYNNYIMMGGTGNPRTTWSDLSDQIIIIRADVASAVGVRFLAGAFNLSYAEYATKQIIVDSFAAPSVLAVVADVNAFQIREKLRRFTTFYNAGNMAWQYYLHAWDTYSMSPFHNCVALVTA